MWGRGGECRVGLIAGWETKVPHAMGVGKKKSVKTEGKDQQV